MKRKPPFTIRLSDELKTRLKKVAKKYDTSMSGLIKAALELYLTPLERK